jgi:hypothetical protein
MSCPAGGRAPIGVAGLRQFSEGSLMLLGIIASAVAAIRSRSAKRRGKGASSERRRAESVERMFCKAELNRGLEELAAYHARRQLVFDRVTGDIIVIEAGDKDRRPAGARASEPAPVRGDWSPSPATR